MHHPDTQKTFKGALFLPTGETRNIGTQAAPRIYVRAQMLPIHPQRFEWIAQRNIKGEA